MIEYPTSNSKISITAEATTITDSTGSNVQIPRETAVKMACDILDYYYISPDEVVGVLAVMLGSDHQIIGELIERVNLKSCKLKS